MILKDDLAREGERERERVWAREKRDSEREKTR
jgi:hypothetical protein